MMISKKRKKALEKALANRKPDPIPTKMSNQLIRAAKNAKKRVDDYYDSIKDIIDNPIQNGDRESSPLEDHIK